MNNDLFHIDVLGTKISFKSKEDKIYMDQIISLLKEKIDQTQSKLNIKDPLKCSLLTTLFLIDEIMKSEKSSSILLENHIERLVQDLDEALK